MFRLPKLNLGNFYKDFTNLTIHKSLDTVNGSLITNGLARPMLIKSSSAVSPINTIHSYQHLSPSTGMFNSISIKHLVFL